MSSRFAKAAKVVICGVALVVGERSAYAGATASANLSPDHIEFFEQKIRPLLIEHCYPCHSTVAEKIKGEFLLDTRDGIRRGGKSGIAGIVPNELQHSRVIEAVRWTNPDLQMPPKRKLSDQQIADLVAWVNLGAPDPRTAPASAAPAAPSPAKDFWSFYAPKEKPVPSVRDASRTRNPIDQFIQAKLAEKSLTPARRADARTLIRRATFDLTGLPPTPEDVETFVADQSPDAYDRLVERLLSSPRYGERWGRYWLDLARYSDTKGYVYEGREDRRFVHSQHYRDWVIQAFNSDKPYDRFLLEQIAADQLDYPDTRTRQQALPAMGFLTVGRRFLGVVPDIIDDRIDVLLRTTQGLTVACARCHDHKFDPIPTQDYYSLYGILVGSSERIVPVELEPKITPEYTAYKTGLDERTKKLSDFFAAKSREFEARVRRMSTDYLIATLDADKLPPDVFYEIRGADEVIPAVVRQWQSYLLKKSNAFDPVFAPWHALAALPAGKFAELAPGTIDKLKADSSKQCNPLVLASLSGARLSSMKDVARVYGTLMSRAEAMFGLISKIPAKVPGERRLPEDDLEAIRKVLYAADTPARVPAGSIRDVEWYFDEPTRVQLGQLQKDIEAWHIGSAGAAPQAVVLEERGGPQRLPRVFKRGNPSTPGEEVPRQYLKLVMGESRKPFTHSSGRLEMARAIADANNPFTARVMVNRVWQHHFGTGIVATPSDFGMRSDPPSHRELLDWLALEFVRQGWSVKQMHRLIMKSATYQQTSADENPAAAAVDPSNRLLWRMNRTRLDFESIRDSLLASTGGLDLTSGGKPAGIETNRRSVYLLVDRQFLPGVFRAFDFANPDLHIPQRGTTTIPQQALFFLNGKLVSDRARALAKSDTIANAPDDAERVRRMYRGLFQREPSEKQISEALQFVRAADLEKEPTPKTIATPWQYGFAEYDSSSDRMKGFTPLPYFTGDAWQGGPNWPDSALGWVQLTAAGGHAGNDLAHAATRRWVAPRDMTVSIDGKLLHETAAGDGITGRIVFSRKGTLEHTALHNSAKAMRVRRLEVRKGDTIDFVVDLAGNLNSDMFKWSPIIEAVDAPAGTTLAVKWNSYQEFGGPPAPVEPMDPWAMYAQVLLLSNEFVFVD